MFYLGLWDTSYYSQGAYINMYSGHKYQINKQIETEYIIEYIMYYVLINNHFEKLIMYLF